jgi:hypothetical protein
MKVTLGIATCKPQKSTLECCIADTSFKPVEQRSDVAQLQWFIGIYNNHYKDPYYGWDDHQPYSEY